MNHVSEAIDLWLASLSHAEARRQKHHQRLFRRVMKNARDCLAEVEEREADPSLLSPPS